jgi:hypothetical protein
LPEIERQQKQGKEVAFRADAAFAKPEIYEALEERGVKYAIRLPANTNLERDIAELLTRPVGRPSHKPVVWYKSVLYQAASWKTARRVVAKVEHHQGELFPRVGFIVTNLILPSPAVVRFYNKRGTAELPPMPIERGAAVAERDRLQLGKSVAAAGAAEEDRSLVADQPAAAVGQDRRARGEACPVLPALAGRGASDAAPVRGKGAADRGAAGARGIAWARAAGTSVETEARGRRGVCGAEGKGGSSGVRRDGRGRTSPLGNDWAYTGGKNSLEGLEGRQVGVYCYEASRPKWKSRLISASVP